MAEKWTNRIRNNKGTLAKTGLAAVAAGSAIAAYEYSLHQQLESETDAIKFLERKLQPHYRDMLAVCAQLAVKGCLISPTILRLAELTPRSFVKAVGRLESIDTNCLLIKPVQAGDTCMQEPAVTKSHYEPGALLRDITDKGLGGSVYQELVSAAWKSSDNS